VTAVSQLGIVDQAAQPQRTYGWTLSTFFIRLSEQERLARGFFSDVRSTSPESRPGQTTDNLEENSIRPNLNFLSGLVLYGMRYVDRVKIGTVERRSLGPCSRLELRGGDGYRRHSQILQIYCIVQTARCARPSIS
jgi:hypothetical protein